jgi:hypothetical protein
VQLHADQLLLPPGGEEGIEIARYRDYGVAEGPVAPRRLELRARIDRGGRIFVTTSAPGQGEEQGSREAEKKGEAP